jgi:hypothetical protein
MCTADALLLMSSSYVYMCTADAALLLVLCCCFADAGALLLLCCYCCFAEYVYMCTAATALLYMCIYELLEYVNCWNMCKCELLQVFSK